MAGRDSDDDSDIEWAPPKQLEWYKSKANMISSNSMLQTNVREGYGITTLEVVELVEDLISYLLKSLRLLTLKDWLAVAKCIRLRNAQIPKVFHEAAAGTIWTMMLAKVRYNTLTLTLSETAQRRSSSVVSNRSIALITDKFGVALLTEPAILNDANVALVDAVYYSVQKLEENYFEVRAQHLKYDVMDALMMMLIEDDDDLLGTVNSYIKLRRLGARCKTEAADSRHAKASGGRTKKDKDLEDSDTGSDVLRLRRRDRAAARARSAERKRLGKEAQLKKTRDEEELAKAKKEKEEKEAQETRDGLSARVGTAIEHCTLEEWTSAAVFFGLTDAYILYFKELLSDNGGIFANAIGMGKTRAMVLAVLMGHVHFKNWTENEVVAMDLANSTWCDLSDPLALRFCFFSDSPPKNMGRLTKEEAMEMRIDTTDAISKALAAANKLVALRSYVLGGATKHRPAPSAARFVIVCGFGKVDKHVFRAYNTMSVTAQRTIIRKGGPYVEKRVILLPALNSLAMAKQWRNMIANVKHDASEHESSYDCLCLDFLSTVQNAEQQCRDILEKEGLDELEASRRVIFNCFEMQAIASYLALATLKVAYVKDLFTNLSKDYFLVREARAITKSSLKFQNLSNLCSESIAAEDAAKAANILLLLKEVRAKILIGSYKLIVQAVTWLGLREKFSDESVLIIVALMAFAEAITLTEATHVLAEMCVGIVYFNLDSELELKVLGKQDVKTTS
ncbi:hypothetical protein HBI39_141630 [Parastagonospora nodorum]|nr:hypothetical protein HBI39_141630 [Parastagonospora nodorum]